MKMTLFISPSDNPRVRLAHYVVSDDDKTDKDIIEFLVHHHRIDRARLTNGGVHQWPGELVDPYISATIRYFK
ncbi:MAG: hypothetical protein A3G45_03025 [Candidatus Staskawiczbacteria bacterium RIFCSPLOWO2_12_FULL_37_15]|uniref:Uncharacterized protein n=1 Tax=Candidatus Staskawiczbacteria bacterium RIFCSPLOWO2_12_FULL_37_15 TaxID=1802218 RepID=A0A1G2ISS7_9BACT|nr:MAG: hypothetical protein US35_C0006G0013 [Parcubacteria group bacterium GW2011_GWA2_37_10]OGZ77597.1 MAG: hypothetical protein A3G45_03025 [Candidatus Staskawiczbacteria bacterium RIFCSPLOWO2_12_FULL_37_15]